MTFFFPSHTFKIPVIKCPLFLIQETLEGPLSWCMARILILEADITVSKPAQRSEVQTSAFKSCCTLTGRVSVTQPLPLSTYFLITAGFVTSLNGIIQCIVRCLAYFAQCDNWEICPWVKYNTSLFFFISGSRSIVWIHHTLYIYFLVNEHLCCLQFGGIVKKICEYLLRGFWWTNRLISLGHIPRRFIKFIFSELELKLFPNQGWTLLNIPFTWGVIS